MVLKCFFEKKIGLRLFLIAGLLVIRCTDSLDRAPFMSPVIEKEIDAVSTASGKLSITGGSIGKHDVSLGIQMMYGTTGDVWIRLGDSNSTWFFQESLNKSPNNFRSNRINKYIFSNLDADCTYHAWVVGIRNIDTAAVHITFKTKSED